MIKRKAGFRQGLSTFDDLENSTPQHISARAFTLDVHGTWVQMRVA